MRAGEELPPGIVRGPNRRSDDAGRRANAFAGEGDLTSAA